MNLATGQQKSYKLKVNILLCSIFTVFTFTFYSATLNAQSLGSQVILKGKVVDLYTGNPVECELEFRPEGGNKIRIRSNSISGEYEQVFNIGEKVTVSFNAFNVLKEEQQVTIVKQNSGSIEQKQDFKVKVFSQGAVLNSIQGFSVGDNKLNSSGKTLLEDLKTLLRFNRSVYINIEVNSEDTYKIQKIDKNVEPYNELNTKGKKKSPKELNALKAKIASQQAEITSAEKANNEIEQKAGNLSEQRKSTVEELLRDLKGLSDKVKVTLNTHLTTENKSDNIRIVVDKVEDKTK